MPVERTWRQYLADGPIPARRAAVSQTVVLRTLIRLPQQGSSSARPSPSGDSQRSRCPSKPLRTKTAPAPERSQRWLDLLVRAKRSKCPRRPGALRHLHRADRGLARRRESAYRHPRGPARPDHRRRRRATRPVGRRPGRLSESGVRRNCTFPQPGPRARVVRPEIDTHYEGVRALVLRGLELSLPP
jgi:hypothetical protein